VKVAEQTMTEAAEEIKSLKGNPDAEEIKSLKGNPDEEIRRQYHM